LISIPGHTHVRDMASFWQTMHARWGHNVPRLTEKSKNSVGDSSS
jgi:hypothetical protein